MPREYRRIKEYEKEILELKEQGLTLRSIGEKYGFTYDNAMAENFFSILKNECIYRVKLKTYEEARLLIGEYIRFYNNDRIQTKTKLTPLEKRSQFVA